MLGAEGRCHTGGLAERTTAGGCWDLAMGGTRGYSHVGGLTMRGRHHVGGLACTRGGR